MKLGLFLKGLFPKVGIEAVVSHHHEFYSSVTGTAEEAQQKLEAKGIKVIRWAPTGIAIWDPDTCSYAWINFPLELYPEITATGISEITGQLDVFGYGLPSYLPIHQCWMTESWNTYSFTVPTFSITNRESNLFPSSLMEYQGNKIRPINYWRMYGPSLFFWIFLSTNSYTAPALIHEKIDLDLFRTSLMIALRAAMPSRFLINLKHNNILEHLMPELAANIGCEQDLRWHEEDVFEHLLRAVDEARRYTQDPLVKLAVLFHDVGKAATRKEVSSASSELLTPTQPALVEECSPISDAS